MARSCGSSLISESGEGNEPINGGENLVLINGQGSYNLPNNPIIDKRVHDYLKLTKRLVE